MSSAPTSACGYVGRSAAIDASITVANAIVSFAEYRGTSFPMDQYWTVSDAAKVWFATPRTMAYMAAGVGKNPVNPPELMGAELLSGVPLGTVFPSPQEPAGNESITCAPRLSTHRNSLSN